MPLEQQPDKQRVSFAKVVATPTATSWSQVYNAGSFFVVLSLASIDDMQNDNLNAIEKEIFNNLEAEFFSLEEKNLKTIKDAIEKTLATFPQNVSVSLGIAYITHDILYLVVFGGASVHIARDNNVGKLIGSTTEGNLQSASGRLKDLDVIIIKTKKFADIVPHDILVSALKHQSPESIADALSPVINGKDEAEAASIILMYQEIQQDEQVQPQTQTKNQEESKSFLPKDAEKNGNETARIKRIREKIVLASRSLRANLAFDGRSGPFFTHSRKVSLSIFLVLLITLAASILFALQHQEQQKIEKQFREIYEGAQKHYDEGSELTSLNKTLAQEDLTKAESALKDGIGKFKKDSKEYDKLTSLLSDVEKKLTELAQVHGVQAVAVDEKKNPFIANVKKFSSEGKYFTSDENFMYFISDKAIASVDLGNGKMQELIKNNGRWKNIGGFGKYLTNFYVLDTRDGIIKFVPSGNTYTKSDYFSKDKPDLSDAVALAIDSSIWVLSKNGDISKFTRGAKDQLVINGLDKPFTNPIRIFTNGDAKYIYVLDSGNARIVKFDKKGVYQAQFSSEVLKNAKEFEIVEKDNKAFILSDNKIWELPLK